MHGCIYPTWWCHDYVSELIRLEILSIAISYSKLTMPTSGWGNWNDWFINIHSTKKARIYYKGSIKDGWQNATIVVSLEKFDMILLFRRYFQVPFDWNNIWIYVVKYFLCRHRHDLLMSMSCRHNCMSMTALNQCDCQIKHWLNNLENKEGAKFFP